MNIEEVLATTHRVSSCDRIPFRCTCCGECCRHVRQSVPVESLDAFRLAKLLRTRDEEITCMDDFIERYTELALLDECGYFMLMLKVTGKDDACIFLRDNRCVVHVAKPRACRIYSVGSRLRAGHCAAHASDTRNTSTAGNAPVLAI